MKMDDETNALGFFFPATLLRFCDAVVRAVFHALLRGLFYFGLFEDLMLIIVLFFCTTVILFSSLPEIFP